MVSQLMQVKKNGIKDTAQAHDCDAAEDVHTVREDKLDEDLDFDPAKNKWVKVLMKVNREMTKLKKEQHILQTFAASESKAGPKKVRQTHEGQRCLAAIKRSKEVWCCLHRTGLYRHSLLF